MYIRIIRVLQAITRSPDVDKVHYVELAQALRSAMRREGAWKSTVTCTTCNKQPSNSINTTGIEIVKWLRLQHKLG